MLQLVATIVAYTYCVTSLCVLQGVQWILLRNPTYIYGDDFRVLHELMGDNFRPVQPLNSRIVTATVP